MASTHGSVTGLRLAYVKKLTLSDACTSKQIKLPKTAGETFLPVLNDKEACQVEMVDEQKRRWAFTCTRYGCQYALSKIGGFVQAHGVAPDIFLIFYWDDEELLRIACRWELPCTLANGLHVDKPQQSSTGRPAYGQARQRPAASSSMQLDRPAPTRTPQAHEAAQRLTPRSSRSMRQDQEYDTAYMEGGMWSCATPSAPGHRGEGGENDRALPLPPQDPAHAAARPLAPMYCGLYPLASPHALGRPSLPGYLPMHLHAGWPMPPWLLQATTPLHANPAAAPLHWQGEHAEAVTWPAYKLKNPRDLEKCRSVSAQLYQPQFYPYPQLCLPAQRPHHSLKRNLQHIDSATDGNPAPRPAGGEEEGVAGSASPAVMGLGIEGLGSLPGGAVLRPLCLNSMGDLQQQQAAWQQGGAGSAGSAAKLKRLKQEVVPRGKENVHPGTFLQTAASATTKDKQARQVAEAERRVAQGTPMPMSPWSPWTHGPGAVQSPWFLSVLPAALPPIVGQLPLPLPASKAHGNAGIPMSVPLESRLPKPQLPAVGLPPLDQTPPWAPPATRRSAFSDPRAAQFGQQVIVQPRPSPAALICNNVAPEQPCLNPAQQPQRERTATIFSPAHLQGYFPSQLLQHAQQDPWSQHALPSMPGRVLASERLLQRSPGARPVHAATADAGWWPGAEKDQGEVSQEEEDDEEAEAEEKAGEEVQEEAQEP